MMPWLKRRITSEDQRRAAVETERKGWNANPRRSLTFINATRSAGVLDRGRHGGRPLLFSSEWRDDLCVVLSEIVGRPLIPWTNGIHEAMATKGSGNSEFSLRTGGSIRSGRWHLSRSNLAYLSLTASSYSGTA